MIIAKQMEIRSDIKNYFDLAFEGEIIIVPRKQGRNVVILSETEFNRLNTQNRMNIYAKELPSDLRNTSSGTMAEAKPVSMKEENLKRLNAILSLKENWNGNGAPAFSPVLINKAKRFVENLPVQPEIFPTALQTIQLEYENSRRDHMEIEIGESKTADIFIVSYTGAETEESIPATIAAIKERVLNFYG